MPGRSTPVTLFYASAPEDEALRLHLEEHLSLLKREGLLAPWHHRDIVPGEVVADAIDEHLNQAQIILLLVSASHYSRTFQREVTPAQTERRWRGQSSLPRASWQCSGPACLAHGLPRQRPRPPPTRCGCSDTGLSPRNSTVGLAQKHTDMSK